MCGQAANRRVGKEQVVLSVCSPGSASVNIPLLSVCPSLLSLQTGWENATFSPPHTFPSDTCPSWSVLKATDISFFYHHKAIFAPSTDWARISDRWTGHGGGEGVGGSIEPAGGFVFLRTEDGEDGRRMAHSLSRWEVLFLKHFTASLNLNDRLQHECVQFFFFFFSKKKKVHGEAFLAFRHKKGTSVMFGWSRFERKMTERQLVGWCFTFKLH